MKKLLLLMLTFHLCIIGYSQIISGTVLDKDTKIPVGFAYIYFNGTSVGTQSDQNGKFLLDVSKNASNTLTVSAIGYYSYTTTDYTAGKSSTIYLVPKVFELNEIIVDSKSLAKKRRNNMIIFKEIFLGKTENARYCEILNESDIKFNYDSDQDTLKAFCLKPLVIINQSLGYKIDYYLDKFEYMRNDQTFLFQGNITFREDQNLNESKSLIIEKKREDAYLGSRMHFFRALWLNDLESNGFTLKNIYGRNLSVKGIVVQDASGKKYLKYSGRMGICFFSKEPISHLVILKDKIYFDRNGYFDPSEIIWEGYIAEKRIADMLPLEYMISAEGGR